MLALCSTPWPGWPSMHETQPKYDNKNLGRLRAASEGATSSWPGGQLQIKHRGRRSTSRGMLRWMGGEQRACMAFAQSHNPRKGRWAREGRWRTCRKALKSSSVIRAAARSAGMACTCSRPACQSAARFARCAFLLWARSGEGAAPVSPSGSSPAGGRIPSAEFGQSSAPKSSTPEGWQMPCIPRYQPTVGMHARPPY